MEEFKNIFREKFRSYFGCDAKPALTDKCAEHFAILVKYNEMFNLTRIVGVAESVLLHYMDSFFVARSKPEVFKNGIAIVDIGSGGGFPAIPLYIYLTEQLGLTGVRMTLIESSKKKTDFLKTTVAELGLAKVTCLPERVEDTGVRPQHREKYDIVTARALSSLPVLVEFCVPLLKVGGLCLLMKGEDIAVELAASAAALKELRSSYMGDFVYEIETMQYKRRVLIIKKDAHTQGKYPRKPGIPKKMPIA